MPGERVNTIGTSKTPQRKGNNAPFGYVFFRDPHSCKARLTGRDGFQDSVERLLFINYY